MNMKRLVLGTAAGALAVTGVSSAQAADLPVVVDPVDYVRICDAYGAGYYFIPGTETCLRVAGRVRADYNVYFGFGDNYSVPNSVSPAYNINNGGTTAAPSISSTPLNQPNFIRNRGFATSGNAFRLNGARGFGANEESYRFRARGYIYLESRSATEFGLLRTYTELQFTHDNAATNGVGVNLDSAVIQFGGLIFGRTDSLYDYDDVGGNWQTFGRFASDQKINLIGYQAAFGNGFSAAISLEDNQTRSQGVLQFVNTGFPTLVPGVNTFNTSGTIAANVLTHAPQIPDIVGNIRVDQGWGSAQLMAAGHYVQANGIQFPLGGQRGDGRDDAYGFAVGGGVNFNVPFGNGTTIGVQANYAHGAISYALANSSYLGYVDGIVDSNGNINLVDVFSVEGVIGGSLSPNVVGSLGVGYAYIDHDAVQVDPGGFSQLESLDSNNFGVTGYVGYRPVSGLEFGVGADFVYQDTDDFGSASALSTFFRAQRTF